MSDIGGMVETLIAAGCAADVAARIVSEAFVAGVLSAPVRGQSADEIRREKDRIRKQNVRRQSADKKENDNEHKRIAKKLSSDSANSPLSKNIKIERERRGRRLSADWKPSDDERSFAKQLGWSDAQIDNEAANFRDYWVARPGAGAVKLDWTLTWRKWIRSSKTKPTGPPALSVVVEKITLEEAVAQFAKLGRLSRYSPISDISQAPPELLAKHGMLPDGRKSA